MFTPLGVAIKLGNLEAVRWLLEHDACPTQRCTRSLIVKPLDLAAEEKKAEIVQMLLANDNLLDDSNSYGALYWAVYNQNVQSCKAFHTKRIRLR